MQALAKLLEANSDSSDTRHNILTADEVTEIKRLRQRNTLFEKCLAKYAIVRQLLLNVGAA